MYFLVTLPKMVRDPSGGHDSQVENHWFSCFFPTWWW